MSRSEYGEGSIYARADGRWCATYWDRGKRMAVYGRTEREARAARRAALKRINDGLPGAEPRTSFAAAAKRWKEVTSHTLNLTSASRQNYVDVLRLHVEPVIGTVKLAQAKPSHVEEVMVAMQAKNLSPSYRNQAHKAMSHVFKMALKDGLIGSNPCRQVPAPRGPARAAIKECVRHKLIDVLGCAGKA